MQSTGIRRMFVHNRLLNPCLRPRSYPPLQSSRVFTREWKFGAKITPPTEPSHPPPCKCRDEIQRLDNTVRRLEDRVREVEKNLQEEGRRAEALLRYEIRRLEDLFKSQKADIIRDVQALLPYLRDEFSLRQAMLLQQIIWLGKRLDTLKGDIADDIAEMGKKIETKTASVMHETNSAINSTKYKIVMLVVSGCGVIVLTLLKDQIVAGLLMLKWW